MALSLNVNALSVYTDQVQLPIIRNSILAPTLMDCGINYQEGVTEISALNIFSGTLTVKAGGACSAFSGSSNVNALTQTYITVYPMLVEEEDCPDVFKNYWTKVITKAGSYNESDPDELNRIYVAYKKEQIAAYNEDSFFCGALSGTYSASLNQTNGVLYQMESTSATASVIVAGGSYSGGMTPANAINLFYNLKNAVPLNIVAEKDLTMFMNHAQFFNLTQALTTANYFHDWATSDGSKDGNYVIKNCLGSNITVRAMRGLQYTNKIILTNASNLYLGTDLKGDSEQFRIWYSNDYNTVRTQIKWRLGAQVAFPQNVVLYKG